MSIDLKTVKHISKLARISIDDEKANKLKGDLNNIFQFIEKLNELNVTTCKNDPALFVWHHNNKLNGIICTHVDDFFYCGTSQFFEQVIKPINQDPETELYFL